jgi:hypothetical protein
MSSRRAGLKFAPRLCDELLPQNPQRARHDLLAISGLLMFNRSQYARVSIFLADIHCGNGAKIPRESFPDIILRDVWVNSHQKPSGFPSVIAIP